jgi:hypothetical protein
MPALEMVDESFVAAPPAQVAAALSGQRRWRRWWPDLALTVVADRGELGLRWAMAGALHGTLEMWLEPVLDGTVLHQILHAELPGARPRELADQQRRRRLAAKAIAFELKATLEGARPPGEPPGTGPDHPRGPG